MSSYEREQERLMRLWKEVEEDEIGGSSEDEEDVVEGSDHDTQSEVSEDEEIIEEEIVPKSDSEEEILDVKLSFIGRDKKTLWSKFPVVKGTKTRSRNIVTQASGVSGHAKNAKNVLEAWELFFPDNVIQEVVDCTNKYINKVRPNYVRDRDARETDSCEIRAVIGLLYLAGVLRSSHQNLRDLWEQNDGTGVEYFPLVMGINRFQFLLRALRFDDITDRENRKQTDKLAAVRSLLDGFGNRCQQHYSLSELVTVDEMLEAFRGRCSFRQYMPKKPARYGLKIFALVDAKSFYTWNLELYAGKQPEGPYNVPNGPYEIVTRLTANISGTGRNVTCDNWFTSIPLAMNLYDSHKLTIVGTLKKNKREIPDLFTATMKERVVNSSIFGYTDKMTLLSYKPKKDKIVMMLSTMHYTDEIDANSGEAYKPSMITFYNATKGGVDVVDELKANYSVSRVSRRWPLTVFFTLLNIGGINSQIIHTENTGRAINRRDYIKRLGMNLCEPYLRKRVDNPCLSRKTRSRIREVLGIQEPTESVRQAAPGRCYLCSSKKNRKTSTQCNKCQKFICREHTVTICRYCADCEEALGSGDE